MRGRMQAGRQAAAGRQQQAAAGSRQGGREGIQLRMAWHAGHQVSQSPGWLAGWLFWGWHCRPQPRFSVLSCCYRYVSPILPETMLRAGGVQVLDTSWIHCVRAEHSYECAVMCVCVCSHPIHHINTIPPQGGVKVSCHWLAHVRGSGSRRRTCLWAGERHSGSLSAARRPCYSSFVLSTARCTMLS